MAAISKHLLKQQIDRLDSRYLELAYNILRQFPHDTAALPRRRKPSARIAGKGRIVGDILAPVVSAEDWNALQ